MLDDTNLAQLTPEQISELNVRAETGSQMREMCRMPAWTKLQKKIENKITDERNSWLKAKTKEEANDIRVKAQVWNEFLDWIKKDLMRGDQARQMLGRHAELSKNSRM